MKKQLHCLSLVLILVLIWNIPKSLANTPAEDFSGCCKPPIDLIYWCKDLPYDFNPWNSYQLQALFGKPQNSCYTNVWVELEPTVNLSNCETGTIIRHFQMTGHYGYEYCNQTITIKGTHNYEIRFPADQLVSCGESPQPEELWTSTSGCDLLAISVTDENFSASGTGCGKIFRTYRVINWCEYDGISDRVIISRDEDCDGAPGDEDVWVLRREDGYAFIDRDNQEYNGNPRAYERSVCTPSNPKGYWRKVRSVGFWQYTQHIKINDLVPPVIIIEQPDPICSYSATCDAMINIPFTVSDDCTPYDIKIKVFIDGIKVSEYAKGGTYIATGKYILGAHQLEIHATDGCGNPTVLKIPFQIVDCKAPALICINGVAVSLMPTPPNTDVDGDGIIDAAAMTLWATDLITSQMNDCSGVAGYSINRVGEQASLSKTSLTLTCEDPDTVYIEINAWDKAYNPYARQPDGTLGGRNRGYCRTYVILRDNNNRCAPPAVILGAVTGNIQTEDAQGLESVNVTLISTDSSQHFTGESGDYQFDSLAMSGAYRILPSLEGDYQEGITMADLMALQRHILGTELINSPYKLIAADINHSNDITLADLMELRQLMLGITDHFANNTSWRFIDAAHVFPDPANPWSLPFPESIEINQMSSHVMSGNFVAVKIGDINGSIMADREATSARNTNTANLLIEDQVFQAGDWLEVPVRVPSDLDAAWFELEFNPQVLEMSGIDYGLAQAENLNLKETPNGSIRVVWNKNVATYSTTLSNTLFTLRFHAVQAAQLREALGLSERHSSALAPQTNRHNTGLALQFVDAKLPDGFALYPNAPNPFREETVLSFQLPETTVGTMRIYDLTGKLLWQKRGEFAQGHNQLTVTRASLAAEGVLLYTLETPTHQATGKMIVLPR